ncbi:DUF4038 domain-containing protein [Blastopirellula sp. JC732]|uniref:DUF4038 domain-containing protein n=1 Tax=Blastopirellula sediminis TaxID=2894196 RepID=A0A9X1SH04_9BACT|nr:DUF4038 domain-containing protein [Blastopirellula sediminis]MCC9606780.1 DUF4038 domain-containing protein [Blastopirellula sediminis]MCC9629923.1 DUF4038 domain-containing protein [Blastopirellula sediminis]
MFRPLAALAVILFTAMPLLAANVARYDVFDQALECDKELDKPLWDARVYVDFTSPSGKTSTVEAFWDGDRTWRFRQSPNELGPWKWTTRCQEQASLSGKSGTFDCIEYFGDSPVYKHGPIRLTENRLFFQYEDGTPFFFLGDTAWNGVLKATDEQWDRYLTMREQQEFTVIQFVSTQWRGGDKTIPDRVYYPTKPIGVNAKEFQRLDKRVVAINQHGMVACPVVLWALNPSDPGNILPEKDAQRLAEYIKARWGAYNVIWMLSGDCPFKGDSVERWKRIGQNVFGDSQRLCTLHASGQNWIVDKFADQSWYDFVGYQSGHGDAAGALNWHVAGPVKDAWNKAVIARPIVNLEPNYEAHPAYESKKVHDGQHVRRAAYWSLLISPPAGVTFGHNSIWIWNEKKGDAESHGNLRNVEPWTAGLETPGTKSMTVLYDFFASGPREKLRPDQDLLASQLGEKNRNHYVAAASTEDGAWQVVYLPVGGKIGLKAEKLQNPRFARWFNPRTGEFSKPVNPTADGSTLTFEAPNSEDWVLDLRRELP